jgi:hypothetical protein
MVGFGLALLVAGVALTFQIRSHRSQEASPGPPTTPLSIYVNSSTGTNAGGSASHPYKTIQDALDVARPGTIIHLERGVYEEEPKTRIDGTNERPIVVEGQERGMSLSDRYKTVLYGIGHVFTIQNNHYVLRGFTIDGEQGLEEHRPLATWPTRPSAIYAFKQSVQGFVENSHPIVVDGGPHKDVTGTVIDDMWISSASGECVRFRDGASGGIVENSVIEWCGLEARSIPRTYPYHNGEGVYIGTSPKSTSETRHLDDPTNHITVTKDRIFTFGSECVDIKENAFDNSVVSVSCGYNQEPLSDQGSNLEIRGYGNIVRDNVIIHSRGYGVKIASDAPRYDNGSNSVEDNVFMSQRGAAIVKLDNAKEGHLCGNTLESGAPLAKFGAACRGPAA